MNRTGNINHKIAGLFLCSGLLAIFFMAGAMNAMAAQQEKIMKAAEVLASPQAALLSPAGGRLEVVDEVAVRTADGASHLELVLPADAENPEIYVHDHTIVRWSSSPVILDSSSAMSQRRAKVEAERMVLAARLVTLKARLAVWQSIPENGAPGDLTQRQSQMQAAMPELVREQEEVEKRLSLIQRELASIPSDNGLGQIIRVDLAKEVGDGHKVRVSYNYDFPRCGWSPMYSFNAMPDEGAGDMIEAKLMAQVWQYSGIDWKGTKITLASRGMGAREPEPLKEWVIDSTTPPAPKPVPRLNMARKAKGADHAEEAVALSAAPPPAAPVDANTTTVYATWNLTEKGLPEGLSRLQIVAATWKAPLQWLARPSKGDTRVWLLAKYTLPTDQAWPQGLAEYSVNGQNVGEGSFTPKSGEATLYFGADPRVNVLTTIDNRKRGEIGFITASKTWTWGWTYTITNEHNKAIVVRVERPAPQIVDEGVKVSYDDNPRPKENDKEHMLYWEIEVPGHGKKSIEHSVTISSPIKLPLLPDVP